MKKIIKESSIRKVIRNSLHGILYENEKKADNSKWQEAIDLKPSADVYTELIKAEGKVPFIYDDKDFITGSQLYNRLYKCAYKIMPNLKNTVYQKMSTKDKNKIAKEIAKELYNHPVFKYHRTKLKGPKGIASPVFDYKKIKGYPTIGAGHLVYKKNQIDEREKYKDYFLPEIIKNILYDRTANTSGIAIKELFMGDSDLSQLFKLDVDRHTQFKQRIAKPITQSMFDALTSFAFNAGWEEINVRTGRKMPIQKIINLINKEKYSGAKNTIQKLGIHSAGSVSDYLKQRRKKESKKFGKDGLKPSLPNIKSGS